MVRAIRFGSGIILLVATTLANAQTPPAAAPDAGLYGGLHWRQLGPFRGGWATVVEGVPRKPNTFYAGTAGGGVWETEDAGRTWQPVFQDGPAASIGALAVAPSSPNVIYIGTGQSEPRYDIAAGLGVFKSTDGGAHWTALGLQNTRYIGRIWVNPKNPNLVLVGAQGHFFGASADRGLYRSTNGGATWSRVLKINDWTGVVDIASDPRNPKIVFAAAWEAHQFPWLSYFEPVVGVGSAIYKSTDGGKSWSKLSGGGWPTSALGRIGLAVTHTVKGTRIYAAVDSKEAGGLYRSDDNGAHWMRANKSDSFTSWYASRLTVSPNDPDVVYTVGQSIRRCVQGGKTCEIIKGAPGGDDYHHIWINPLRPDHMITGSDQGAVVSVNGGSTWSSWYNQPTGQFYHLEVDNRFPYWIYSGQQDSGTVAIASRSDYGQLTYRDWHPVGGEERDYDIPDPADAMTVYGSGLGGHVSKWNERTGQVEDVTPWPESNYGKRPTLTKYHYMWTTPLAASRTGPTSLYLGAQALFRSRDQGKNWSLISGDLTGKMADAKNCDGDVSLPDAKICGYGSISAIAPSPRYTNEIWVGTDDGLIQHTRDGGAHWSDITPAAVPLWAKVQTIDLSTFEDGVAYAAIDGHRIDDFQPHVLRTRDYGQSWQEIDGGLPHDHFVSVIRADPVKQGLLYAGTDEGVFVSFDDGSHWTPLQQNLPTAWITDLMIHGDDLIAATQGRAIWVLDDVEPLREIGSTMALEPMHLFTPARAYRVHPDNNKDTPLPPETPVGENPPSGAVIDYWLRTDTKGPVTLEILDGDSHVVRHWSSEDIAKAPKAERYFAKSWTRRPDVLTTTAGMHRFVWDLHYDRPDAIKYAYSIAAVWDRGTPIEPEGPFVLPGHYTVALQAGGTRYTTELAVLKDPRVMASPSELMESLVLSRKIERALADACDGYREQQALLKLLDARFPITGGGVDAETRALVDRLREKPAENHPTFETTANTLTSIEGALESVDAGPTQTQQQFLADTLTKLNNAKSEWAAVKAGPLADLNAALKRAGEHAVVITNAEKNSVEVSDPGQDLP